MERTEATNPLYNPELNALRYELGETRALLDYARNNYSSAKEVFRKKEKELLQESAVIAEDLYFEIEYTFGENEYIISLNL